MQEQETALWNWLLFSGVLSTQRAKTLLQKWQSMSISVQQALAEPEKGPLGLTPEESRKLHAPRNLHTPSAVRWNESDYPAGLQRLPLKIRPALFFYCGEKQLLSRPVVYFPPTPLQEHTIERTRETLNLLLGEALLPATLKGSPQAALLLQEMETSEGEALLFTRSGLNTTTTTAQEALLLDQQRLVIATPLPENALPDARLDTILNQVEAATASYCVFTGSDAPVAPFSQTPTLWITSEKIPGTAASPKVKALTEPMELVLWITNGGTTPSPMITKVLTPELPEAPDLTPEETLQILEKGGNIPDILKKRLTKK